MDKSTGWPRIAVVGAGAVGGYYGGMLARAGAPVVMIGRPAFVETVGKSGVFLDSLTFQEHVPVTASTELSTAADSDLILFCVKTTDTADVVTSLSKLTKKKPLLIAMQNGVDNADRIRAHWDVEVLPAAVYVAAAMNDPGIIKHTGRGDLVIGPKSETTERVSAMFEKAGIPCRITDNIEGELWTKLIWNCAANAISALGNVTYGRLTANADGLRMVRSAVEEVLSVAHACSISPAGMDVEDPGGLVARKLNEQMPTATSSTQRDLVKGKQTEIESLNGYVVRMGDKLGIPTPVNHTLYALTKFAERSDVETATTR